MKLPIILVCILYINLMESNAVNLSPQEIVWEANFAKNFGKANKKNEFETCNLEHFCRKFSNWLKLFKNNENSVECKTWYLNEKTRPNVQISGNVRFRIKPQIIQISKLKCECHIQNNNYEKVEETMIQYPDVFFLIKDESRGYYKLIETTPGFIRIKHYYEHEDDNEPELICGPGIKGKLNCI